MSTTLMPPGQWDQHEFAFAQWGDSRRNKRLVKIATNLAVHPGGTLPQAFPDWAELKAAHRFFGQSGVTFQRVLAPHLERTRQRCRQPGEYLLITLLDYSRHRATEGLGVIGDGGGRGFELHIANHNNFGTLVGRVALRPDAPRSARRTTSTVPMSI